MAYGKSLELRAVQPAEPTVVKTGPVLVRMRNGKAVSYVSDNRAERQHRARMQKRGIKLPELITQQQFQEMVQAEIDSQLREREGNKSDGTVPADVTPSNASEVSS